MRLLVFLLLIPGFGGLAIAHTYPEPDSRNTAASDRDEIRTTVARMQGKWICVWDQRDGKVDDPQIGTMFVFKGTEMTHQFPDGRSSRWEYRVRPETNPMGIDWRLLKESHAGRFEPGIFWFMGDTLVFCDGFPVDKRPTDFGDASHLNVLRRVSAGDASDSDVSRQDAASKKQLGIQENAWVDAYDFVVSAKSNQDNPVATKIWLQEGEVFIIEPDTEAKWGAHGPDGPVADYRGLGRTDSLLALFFRVGESGAPVIAGRPITVISPGELELYCQDNQPGDNVGQLGLKVIRLKTNK